MIRQKKKKEKRKKKKKRWKPLNLTWCILFYLSRIRFFSSHLSNTPDLFLIAAGDQACQDKCNNQYVCGKVKLDPTKVTKSSTSITMSPSESPVIQLGQAPLSSNVSLGVYLVLLSITVVWMAMFGRTL
ncbi:hypothetical protein HMI54_000771 [Coelomomyces lativittatus]|nr:hypothetical protein HMI56_002838 [Coelomomyces lativittatus]KAJ1511493.1 hypothetical protein HMI54_000771 [Coelomomyces lativittatus]